MVIGPVAAEQGIRWERLQRHSCIAIQKVLKQRYNFQNVSDFNDENLKTRRSHVSNSSDEFDHWFFVQTKVRVKLYSLETFEALHQVFFFILLQFFFF